MSIRQSYLDRISSVKLHTPLLKPLKPPSPPIKRESSARKASVALAKKKTEEEKAEEKKRRWVPDPEKSLTGKPFGWKIYQESDSTKCQIWKVPLPNLNYVHTSYKNHLQSHKQSYTSNYFTYDTDFKFYCPACEQYFTTRADGYRHMLHMEKIRRVKLAFANQVIIQQQEDDVQETKPTKQKRKRKKSILKKKENEENEMRLEEMEDEETEKRKSLQKNHELSIQTSLSRVAPSSKSKTRLNGS